MTKNYESFKSFADMGGQVVRQAAPPSQQGSSSGPRSSQQKNSKSDAPDLPPNYLPEPRRYFDDKGHLLRQVFIDWPDDLAKKLTKSYHPDAMPHTTKNSLRAFYSMLRVTKRDFDFEWSKSENKPEKSDQAWGNAKNQLYRMRTAAKYQTERRVISRLCQRFLEANIDAVLKEGAESSDIFRKLFNAFVEHFQAVIAYLPERSDR